MKFKSLKMAALAFTAIVATAMGAHAAIVQAIWTGSASGVDPGEVLHNGETIDAMPFTLTYTWDTANTFTNGTSSGHTGVSGGDSMTSGDISSVKLTVGSNELSYTGFSQTIFLERLSYGYEYYGSLYGCSVSLTCPARSDNSYMNVASIADGGVTGSIIGNFGFRDGTVGTIPPRSLLLSGQLTSNRIFGVLLTSLTEQQRTGSVALSNGLSLSLISDRVQRVLVVDQGGGGGTQDVPLPAGLVLLVSGLSALGLAKGSKGQHKEC
jgi:hypothetical protein